MSDAFEQHIQTIAQNLYYPPMKPTKTRYLPSNRAQMLRRVAIALFVIGLAGFAIPDIRAAVLEILRLGAVTITLDGQSMSGETLQLKDVYGETDLETAQANISYEMLIPPDDLPHKIFLQDDELLIFVWLENNEITQALYQIPVYDWGVIKQVAEVELTNVGASEAFWVNAQHPVQFKNGETEFTYFVNDNVLIWGNDIVTYRLETRLDMEAAQAFAESLTPP